MAYKCNGKHHFAKGKIPPKRRKQGEMNGLETRYAAYLDGLKAGGDILDYEFEPCSLRLGYKCTYSPDFLVTYADRMEFHETKGGFVRDDSIVKFKTAAEKFWQFGFVMVFWKAKQWEFVPYAGNKD